MVGALAIACAAQAPTSVALETSGMPAETTNDTFVDVDSSSTGDPTTSSDGDSSTGSVPCCGCLCGDPTWSCTAQTCLDDDAHALELRDEAGFFELASGSYFAEGTTAFAPVERVFYAFHPADREPENKPLFVFFNGGPGTATAILLGLNTAPFTLDPDLGDGVFDNPASWTSLGNLLHIDAPATGFSYSLRPVGETDPGLVAHVDRDAAAFVRVLLRFLERHPQLGGRIVLVGESYGGKRATRMLHHLVFYESLAGDVYRDIPLGAEIVAYLDRVDGRGDYPPERIAERFAAVMIQPALACGATTMLNPCFGDPFQCDEPNGTEVEVDEHLHHQLVDPTTLATVLGADPSGIEWMYAATREGAFDRALPRSLAGSEGAMAQVFGTLGAADCYQLPVNQQVFGELGSNCPSTTIEDTADVARLVPLFITNARLDGIVNSEEVPAVLETAGFEIDVATIDPGIPADAARPGVIRIVYHDDQQVDVRFPTYENAGHAVSWRAPLELRDDVGAWIDSLP